MIRKRKFAVMARVNKAARRTEISRRPAPVFSAPEAPDEPGRTLAVRRVFRPASGRSFSVPRFWRCLDPFLSDGGCSPLRERSRAYPASGQSASGQAFKLRQLVLQAKRLPYLVHPASRLIFMPPLALGVAAAEIRDFESERTEPPPQPAGADNWLWVLAFLCLLLFWDGLRHSAGQWGLAALPWEPRVWVDLGGLERAKVAAGEWWRVFTALTLHVDAAHVLGNCVFGAVFMLPLCRRAGLGAGLFLTVGGGALGNLLNIFFQQPGTVSVGFSTAVFAALGALCGLAAHDAVTAFSVRASRTAPAAVAPVSGGTGVDLRREYGLTVKSVFISLAVGLAFLAFLGGNGEPQIDFSAHALGLVGGLLLALGLSFTPFFQPGRPRRSGRAQAVCLLLTIGLPALSWYLAFLRYWRG